MKGTSKTVLKRNYQTLIEQGRETRFGPQWKGIRCGAKTRRGTPCLKPAIKHKTRCQLHGGRSTGARTPEGLQKLKDIHWKHGQRSLETIERSRYYRNELKRLVLLCRQSGLMP